MTTEFAAILCELRRRVDMTQADLAAAVGYSPSYICNLEKGARLPDLAVVTERFVPALALDDAPHLAVHLVETAAAARGLPAPEVRHLRRLPAAGLTAAVVPSSTLPPTPAPIIGRDADIGRICRRMTGHYGRLLTLIGPPGVGKTRLALAVAHRLQALYAGGACFVDLTAIDQPALLLQAVAAALGVEIGGSNLARELAARLRRRQLLLVLDNFEQILAAAPDVADLLAECPELRILVTSRERLHLRAEQRYRVPPLDLEPAVALFAQRAAAAAPGWHASHELRPLIAQICAALDGLPLAIELIAVQVDRFPLPVLLDRLGDRRLDLLSDGPSHLPLHHRTLTNALHRSYVMLSPAEQELFAALSVFAGGCAVDAVAALGCDQKLIPMLAAKSLVRLDETDGQAPRMAMLETVREYAHDRLLATGREQWARREHAAHYLTVARSAAAGLLTAARPEWLVRLDRDHDNMRSALRWFIEHDAAAALELAAALADYWHARSYFDEGRSWLARTLAAYARPDRLRAHALVGAANLAIPQYAIEAARTYLEESLAIFRQLGDDPGVAAALAAYGWLDSFVEPAQAIAVWNESLAILRRLDDRVAISRLLPSMLNVMIAHGVDHAAAHALLAESLELARELGTAEEIARSLLRQGSAEVLAGRYAAGEQPLREAASLLRQLGSTRELAWAQEELGEALLLQGKYDAAQAELIAAGAGFEMVGDRLGLAIVIHHRAQIERRSGAPAAAALLYRDSLDRSLALGSRQMVARCLAGLGCAALQDHRLTRAAVLLGAAQAALAALPPFLPPEDAAELAALMEAACAAMPPGEFDQAWGIGQNSSTAALLHYLDD